jgi:hypothetical protein
MQEDPGPKDPGPNRLFDKKRKAVEVPNPNTSEKRIRTSKSPSEAGDTVSAEPQWPDYFREVSVHEGSLTLTLGTSSVSCSRYV